ncbi:MAG: PAS domain-containing protein [Chloroflexota bacterium]|nr:PAS domain-containing protein [Chloroflexota bacterium]
MRDLALKIRENLEKLAEEYIQRLDKIQNYQDYSAKFSSIAQGDLILIATCLESEDEAKFITFTQEKAQERLKEGFAGLPLLEALTAIENTLSPLITDVETAKFLWHMLSESRNVIATQIAEQSYYHKQEFLWRVIDTIPSFIFVRDRQGKFILANQALADTYNTNVKDIVGKTDADFNPNPEEIELIQRDDLEVMDSLRKKFIPEQTITGAEGDMRWVQVAKLPLVDEDGIARRVLGIANDITERKQLEQEIQTTLDRRSRQVETGTEIAQDVVAATDLDEIYRRVVKSIKERFNYYHAQIFRHDPQRDAMVVIEGYGEAGKKMIAAEHSLPYGKGVVGAAAASGDPVLAANVTKDPDWVPHPDLPKTRGELAVPIKWRDEVLGILDVQSDEADALTEEDQVMLVGLAGQIASAIESTRLYSALTRQQYLMNAMMNYSPDAIYFKDTKSRFIKISQAQADRFGLDDPAQAVGKTDFDFFSDEHAQAAYEDEQNIMRSSQPIMKEEKESWPNRPDTWVSTNKLPLRDEKGHIVGTFGVSRDITEHKRMDDALAEERNVLRTIIDNIPDYIYFKDTHSRFIINNSAHLHSLGLETQEEALGKTDLDFFPEDLAAQYYTDEQKIIKTGAALINREEPIVDQTSGDKMWVSTTKVPLLDSEGNITGLVGVTRDITKRKMSETEMQETMRELERLTHSMSREGWEQLRREAGPVGYRFDQTDIIPADDWWVPELSESAKKGALIPSSDDERTAVAPLSVRGEIIGALGIQDSRDNPLSAEEIALVEALSDDVAQILENARLFKQTQAALDETQTLYNFSRSLTEQETMVAVLQTVVDSVVKALPANRATAITFDLEKKRVTNFVKSGPGSAQVVLVSFDELWNGLSGWVLREQTAALSPKGKADPREASQVQKRRQEINSGSIIVAPLLYRGDMLGTMTVINKPDEPDFTQRDVDFVMTFVHQAVAAVENIRLFEQTQNALDQAKATHRQYLQEHWEKFVPEQIAPFHERTRDGLIHHQETTPTSVETALEQSEDGGTELVVPLILRGTTIGALGLEKLEGDQAWTNDDITLIESVAEQLAIAIESARLLDETQQRAVSEQLVGKATDKMRETLNVDSVLRTAVNEIYEMLDLEHATVQLTEAAALLDKEAEA